MGAAQRSGRNFLPVYATYPPYLVLDQAKAIDESADLESHAKNHSNAAANTSTSTVDHSAPRKLEANACDAQIMHHWALQQSLTLPSNDFIDSGLPLLLSPLQEHLYNSSCFQSGMYHVRSITLAPSSKPCYISWNSLAENHVC